MLILVGLAVVFFVVSTSLDKTKTPNPSPKSTKQDVKVNQLDLPYNKATYRVNWAHIPVPRNIFIGTNLDEKKTAKSVYDENQCQALINGGFYTQNNDYIGLLYVDSKKLSNESQDSFFNGVFYITKSGDVGIGSGVPLAQIKYALQSGPILVRYQAYQKLRINNDEHKRRMVVAITPKEEVLFLTIYDPLSGYLGPKLAEVPDILKKFAEIKDISLLDALNLDGGSASALYTSGVSLGEITHIGSYLCAR